MRHRIRTGCLAVAAAGLLVAGCGGKGGTGAQVASIGGTTTTVAGGSSGNGGGNPQERALAFAKCMRAHGLKDFPDPQPADSGPQTHSQAGGANGGTGPDPNSPQFKSAMQACRNLLPSDAEFNTSSAGGGS